jgi:hypothetical protein
MPASHNINLVIIILISMIFIVIGGALYDLHLSQGPYDNQPLFWPTAVGFSSVGVAILLGLILRFVLPSEILKEMKEITQFGP